ncbi:carboxy-S-adenosyl-L-methionine synthase CmoA [Candidatus Riesia pediculischaeffi]|uniref:Carboxy-S-adenosyl-L-methionine synthase n=1 Tax=Candidatus Riesia pediculischaeffi PTSU TaxID=1401651 RepID=A0A0C1VIY4_9ENTR|nr:carboxy-S-adenosyl-L-methionine synthase CmoA [Candidatus Riesia pediculischaeffi]KIE63760.1 tRNA (uridine-5-oxyacetic acid methyl ester) 34 synthase [Candidatus Riesia pediculischaeffi PTSU]
MKKKDQLSKKYLTSGSWKFNRKVSEVFHDMVHRSIPGYKNISDTIGYFSQKFVQPKSNIYDLGCAIGGVTESIIKYVKNEDCKIISIDKSSDMIDEFKKRFSNKYGENFSVKIMKQDVLKTDIRNASVVILNFTLQFIQPSKKSYILKRIYNGLNKGGILILSEKVRSENKDNLFVNAHKDFKLSNGYSTLEISQKERMLKNVMFVESIRQNRYRLKHSGFRRTVLWFQYLNFISLITFKLQ